jgi:hypothetical protein
MPAVPFTDLLRSILAVSFPFLFLIYPRTASTPLEPDSRHVLHLRVSINFTQYANDFGFKLWESLLGESEDYIRAVLESFFPPTYLPNGEVRRSFVYDRPSPTLKGFSNTADVLQWSAEVQRRIFENQNPRTCAGRSFARLESPWCYGLGSLMQIAAMHLADAMDQNDSDLFGQIPLSGN